MGKSIEKIPVTDRVQMQVVKKSKGQTMSNVREQIMGSKDIPEMEKIEVPEWSTTVGIAVMGALDFGRFQAGQVRPDGTVSIQDIKLALLVRTIVDPETGKRIFDDGEIEVLGQKSPFVIDRLFTVAQRINKIGQDEIDGMVKN